MDKSKTRLLSLPMIFFLFSSFILFTSCKKNPDSLSPGRKSITTGWAYNDEKNGGYSVVDFSGQPTGPNLVFIEGGRTTVGSSEQDIAWDHDNVERTVTVASFYMDVCEIANMHYLEYLHWVQKDSSEEFFIGALPDTTVWRSALAYNDPYVEWYFRYPGFRMFPVVGVSWLQATDFCIWRSNKVNEMMGDKDEEATIENGLKLPNYRLPTEIEWEYAAQALIGTSAPGDENQNFKRIYPWNGHTVRNSEQKSLGLMMGNFKRGKGDYAGVAGRLNDGAMITEEVFSYWPNDYGLYNMGGNVAEWVSDVYRPLSYGDFDDLNSYRGNPGLEGYEDPEKGYDFNTGFMSLVNDKVRVYKGGSWKDIAYWMSPGTRKFLAQDSSTAYIGFRCSMTRCGGAVEK